MDFLYFNPAYLILICTRCSLAVVPTGIEAYLTELTTRGDLGDEVEAIAFSTPQYQIRYGDDHTLQWTPPARSREICPIRVDVAALISLEEKRLGKESCIRLPHDAQDRVSRIQTGSMVKIWLYAYNLKGSYERDEIDES